MVVSVITESELPTTILLDYPVLYVKQGDRGTTVVPRMVNEGNKRTPRHTGSIVYETFQKVHVEDEGNNFSLSNVHMCQIKEKVSVVQATTTDRHNIDENKHRLPYQRIFHH